MLRRTLVALLVCGGAPLEAAEPVDLEMVTRIRHEAFHRSQVMETARELTDVIGPRLTGSPAMKRANEWTRDRLAAWGLSGARLEAYGPFGPGWSFDKSNVRLVAPELLPLPALPKAWTPGTAGPVRGAALRVSLASDADLEAHAGRLAGKVLLLSEPREPKAGAKPLVTRFSEDELGELAFYPLPPPEAEERRAEHRKRRWLRKRLNAYLEEQGALATIEASSRDNGVIRVMGSGARQPGESRGVTGLVMALEPYNRLARLLDAGQALELELEVSAEYHEQDLMAYNTIAEIPGSGPELVMLGAHLDSWHAGTGATDNAAGVAVVLEAARILQALGVKPRRSIRVALWSGEEQGLLGSYGYVSEHFGARRPPEDAEERELPPSLWRSPGPLATKPGHALLSAYFNLDNGTGRIRGVYLQENSAVAPIFAAWLEPFADLGATTLTHRATGGTDHLSFDNVGLPGFQFVQDRMEYGTLTHHTMLDVYDHLERADLMQAAAVMASFVYHAAMRPERLPRKPLPEGPAAPEGEGF